MRKFIYWVLICCLFVASCKKDHSENLENPDQPKITTSLAGFGDRPGVPSGTVFQLPTNINMVNHILLSETNCVNYNMVGVGNISMYFTLANHNSIATNVHFPAGLVFLPDEDTTQSALNLIPIDVTLPPHGTKQMILYFFCINHNKLGSSDNYKMSVVSNNNQVVTLINALSYKNDSIVKKHWSELQEIVWNISDRNGLTQEDLESINSW
jgi:hypothetical protein